MPPSAFRPSSLLSHFRLLDHQRLLTVESNYKSRSAAYVWLHRSGLTVYIVRGSKTISPLISSPVLQDFHQVIQVPPKESCDRWLSCFLSILAFIGCDVVMVVWYLFRAAILSLVVAISAFYRAVCRLFFVIGIIYDLICIISQSTCFAVIIQRNNWSSVTARWMPGCVCWVHAVLDQSLLPGLQPQLSLTFDYNRLSSCYRIKVHLSILTEMVESLPFECQIIM